MFSIIVVWGRVEGREVNALNLLDQGHQGMKVCAGADLDDLELFRTKRQLQRC